MATLTTSCHVETGFHRFIKLAQEVLAAHYEPVGNEAKQFNFEVLLEMNSGLAAETESTSSDMIEGQLENLLTSASIVSARVDELLKLSAYLRFRNSFRLSTDSNPADAEIIIGVFLNLLNLLRANLVQCSLHLKNLNGGEQHFKRDNTSEDAIHSSNIRSDCSFPNVDEFSVFAASLHKAISIVAVMANICYFFVNCCTDRLHVSSTCRSSLLFLKTYAVRTLELFSYNVSTVPINQQQNVRHFIHDIEQRLTDALMNFKQIFATARPGLLTDQVAYSALTTCIKLFTLLPTVFDSSFGNSLLTHAVNLVPAILPHLHHQCAAGDAAAPGDDGEVVMVVVADHHDDEMHDTGYNDEDAFMFYELTSAIVRSPLATSSSAGHVPLYVLSSECRIHFTTALFLISAHAASGGGGNHSAVAGAEFETSGSNDDKQLRDKQAALIKHHDFAYSFLRNLFDKMAFSKTKKGTGDEVSFEVFQCFIDDLLNALGEPAFPLVPKLLALTFRILLGKLDTTTSRGGKGSSSKPSVAAVTSTNIIVMVDKQSLVLDLLTNMLVRVKLFTASLQSTASADNGDAVVTSKVGAMSLNSGPNDVPSSSETITPEIALRSRVAEFIQTNNNSFLSAIDDICSLHTVDVSSSPNPQHSILHVDELRSFATKVVDDPQLASSEAVEKNGQAMLLELFITHQMLKKCQADDSLFETVQTLHCTWQKNERLFDNNTSKSAPSPDDGCDADVSDNDDLRADDDDKSKKSAMRKEQQSVRHRHLLTLNALVDVAKVVKIQWNGQIFSSTSASDDRMLRTACRLLLLKHGYLNDRIVRWIQPLVRWALLQNTSALVASKVTRCLSTLIEIDAALAHDKHLIRLLKHHMLDASPSVRSACLDCVYNFMMSARTSASLATNLPIILHDLTDASKLVRRRAMKMVSQLIGNNAIRSLLVTGAVEDLFSNNIGANINAVSRRTALCCRAAAWLMLAVNGECFNNDSSTSSDKVDIISSDDEDGSMRRKAEIALTQLLVQVLLTMPIIAMQKKQQTTSNINETEFGREVVGQRQIEFFLILMRTLLQVGHQTLTTNEEQAASMQSTLGASTVYSSSNAALAAAQISSALKILFERHATIMPLKADLHTIVVNNYPATIADIGSFVGRLSTKRLLDMLLVMLKQLIEFAINAMHEQTTRLLRLRTYEADNNVPIDERLSTVMEFADQLLEMRPILFAGFVDKFVQILHQLVWSLDRPLAAANAAAPAGQLPPSHRCLALRQPTGDDWRYRALRSLVSMLTRLARYNVIDAARAAPPVVVVAHQQQQQQNAVTVVVGSVVADNGSDRDDATTLTGLIRKCLRWFLLNHAELQPSMCDKFVECWVAIAEVERRICTSTTFVDNSEMASSSSMHGRGYADIRYQFLRLFNLMREYCDKMLRSVATTSGGNNNSSVDDISVQRQRDILQRKLVTLLQINAYIWRHVPTLSVLELNDDDQNEDEKSRANSIKQYILQVLLLCFQFSTKIPVPASPATATSVAVGSPARNNAVAATAEQQQLSTFRDSLLRLTKSSFSALETTLLCVGLFAVQYPELLQHRILAGLYLHNILELQLPPGRPSSTVQHQQQQQQQHSATARWLLQLKFRIIRIYLQVLDVAFPQHVADTALKPKFMMIGAVASGDDNNAYNELTDIEDRQANLECVRVERKVTQVIQAHIEQFIRCGSSASTLLRRECFTLMQKIFRCRLVLPDRYIPFIVALTCDTSPTIAAAGARMLLDIETRYPAFLPRSALSGVECAFRHRFRILTERAFTKGAVELDAVHGFVVEDSDEREGRRSLLSHLARIIHTASPSPRQALVTLFRDLINRFCDLYAVEHEGESVAGGVNISYDLDERLQWQLFVAGALIYLPYASHDELLSLLKTISDRLHPYGSTHFENLMSSLTNNNCSTTDNSATTTTTISLEGEQQVGQLLDALFTPALLATIKLQLMRMYDIDERTIVSGWNDKDVNISSKRFKSGHGQSASVVELKPVHRVTFERTKVVANLVLLIPMLRQQKVALQMQYRRHHQASFKMNWKLELNAQQLYVLVEPLKSAVLRAWGDEEEESAATDKADAELGYNNVTMVESVTSPPATTSNVGVARAAPSSHRRKKDNLNSPAVSTPGKVVRQRRRRRRSYESSVSSDGARDLPSSNEGDGDDEINNDDAADAVKSPQKSKAARKRSVKKQKVAEINVDVKPSPKTTPKTRRATRRKVKEVNTASPKDVLTPTRSKSVRQSAAVARRKLLNSCEAGEKDNKMDVGED